MPDRVRDPLDSPMTDVQLAERDHGADSLEMTPHVDDWSARAVTVVAGDDYPPRPCEARTMAVALPEESAETVATDLRALCALAEARRGETGDADAAPLRAPKTSRARPEAKDAHQKSSSALTVRADRTGSAQPCPTLSAAAEASSSALTVRADRLALAGACRTPSAAAEASSSAVTVRADLRGRIPASAEAHPQAPPLDRVERSTERDAARASSVATPRVESEVLDLDSMVLDSMVLDSMVLESTVPGSEELESLEVDAFELELLERSGFDDEEGPTEIFERDCAVPIPLVRRRDAWIDALHPAARDVLESAREPLPRWPAERRCAGAVARPKRKGASSHRPPRKRSVER